MKRITYRKTNRERLVELLQRIGYKVTKQSTDGTYMLLRLPDGTPTQYWLMPDRIEHRLEGNRGGSYFLYSGCLFELDGDDTVAVISKESNNSVWCAFHNFESHRATPQSKEREE